MDKGSLPDYPNKSNSLIFLTATLIDDCSIRVSWSLKSLIGGAHL